MKYKVLGIAVVLLTLVAGWVEYVNTRTTYVDSFGQECIEVHAPMSSVTHDFLEDHPGCKTVASGSFRGANYAHIECGAGDIVIGAHIAFDNRAACDVFAKLEFVDQLRAVGDHFGRMK